MIAIDTNILIRLAMRDDETQYSKCHPPILESTADTIVFRSISRPAWYDVGLLVYAIIFPQSVPKDEVHHANND